MIELKEIIVNSGRSRYICEIWNVYCYEYINEYAFGLVLDVRRSERGEGHGISAQ